MNFSWSDAIWDRARPPLLFIRSPFSQSLSRSFWIFISNWCNFDKNLNYSRSLFHSLFLLFSCCRIKVRGIKKIAVDFSAFHIIAMANIFVAAAAALVTVTATSKRREREYWGNGHMTAWRFVGSVLAPVIFVWSIIIYWIINYPKFFTCLTLIVYNV